MSFCLRVLAPHPFFLLRVRMCAQGQDGPPGLEKRYGRCGLLLAFNLLQSTLDTFQLSACSKISPGQQVLCIVALAQAYSVRCGLL